VPASKPPSDSGSLNVTDSNALEVAVVTLEFVVIVVLGLAVGVTPDTVVDAILVVVVVVVVRGNCSNGTRR
jgi:hypothetical protein